MKNSRIVLAAALIAAALLFAASPAAAQEEEGDWPPIPRQLGLSDYIVQVEFALPQITPDILAAGDDGDWFAQVTPEMVATAVDDLPAPTEIISNGPITIARDPAHRRFIKIDSDRQRIRYLNKDRQFYWGITPPGATDDLICSGLASFIGATLGMPGILNPVEFLDTVMGLSADEVGVENSPFEREKLVTWARTHNGYPVFESRFRAAVSNDGQCSRLLVEWPAFRIPQGLNLLSRSDLVQSIAERIMHSEQGAEVELIILLGYLRLGEDFVPMAQVGFSDELSGEIAYLSLTDYVSTVPGEFGTTMIRLRSHCLPGARTALIDFELPRDLSVNLKIYDVRGSLVRTLLHGDRQAGPHQTTWDGRDDAGSSVASGVYLVHLEAGDLQATSKLMMLR